MMNDPNSFSAMAGLPQQPPMGASSSGEQSLMAMGMGMGGTIAPPPPMNNLAIDASGMSAPPNYGADPSMMMGGGGYGGGYGHGGGGGYRGRGGRGRGRGMGGMGMGGYGGGGYDMYSGGMGGGASNPMDPSDPRNRCVFFQKMGACRHGDSCTKFHIRPTTGQTVLFPKMYPNPQAITFLRDREWGFQFEERYLTKYFHNFYKMVWRSMMKIARIVELRVVANLCEHLVGNVYVKFADAEKAAYVCENLRHRLHMGILLLPELTPVNDFSEACCKEDRESPNGCKRKLDCNFLHLMKVSREVMEKLVKEQDEHWEGIEKADKAKKEKEAAREKERAERKEKERRERKSSTTTGGSSSHKDEKDKKGDDKDNKTGGASSSSHHRSSNNDRDRDGGRTHRSSDDRREKDRSDRRRDDDRKDKVSSRRDRSRSRSPRGRGDRDRDSGRDRDRDYRRRDRSRDNDRSRRHRSRSRSRSNDRSNRRKRDRSPVNNGNDDRLCMVCGKKGHISKDCSQKV